MSMSCSEDDILTFEVDESETGKRLDAVLASHDDTLSRSRFQNLIREGQVSLTSADQPDRTIEEPKHRVNAGDRITVILPPPEDPTPQGEAIPIDVVFEDDHLIVVNKPAGLVVHPGAGNWTGTLVNALIHHCGDSLSGIGGVRRPGIVHRIDKETSGLLVVARATSPTRVSASSSPTTAAPGRWCAPIRRWSGASPMLARAPSTRASVAPSTTDCARRC